AAEFERMQRERQFDEAFRQTTETERWVDEFQGRVPVQKLVRIRCPPCMLRTNFGLTVLAVGGPGGTAANFTTNIGGGRPQVAGKRVHEVYAQDWQSRS